MTFSILGLCRQTGMLGTAITTSSICVGARCLWVRSGVGAVSSQNVTLPSIGPMILDRIEQGASAIESLNDVMAHDDHPEYRQVVVLDSQGLCAGMSGSRTLGTNAVSAGECCIAAGNLLRSDGLPGVMTKCFESSVGEHLAARLLEALEAGLHEGGGEEGPVHSSALLVHGEHPWPLVDLRVDWCDSDPVAALRRLWTDYEPQMDDYVTRALNPAAAPSYGVPGDE